MTDEALSPLDVHRDDRGTLLTIDLATLPFVPKRVFTVTAPEHPSQRGGHIAQCDEVVALVTGQSLFHVSSAAAENSSTTKTLLTQPGSTLLLKAGEHVEYDLLTANTTVLVFASELYV